MSMKNLGTEWGLNATPNHALKAVASVKSPENVVLVEVCVVGTEHCLATVEYIGGHITLHTKEYVSSGMSNVTVCASDVSAEESFELELSVNYRGEVRLNIGAHRAVALVNWPSYRNEKLVFRTNTKVKFEQGMIVHG